MCTWTNWIDSKLKLAESSWPMEWTQFLQLKLLICSECSSWVLWPKRNQMMSSNRIIISSDLELILGYIVCCLLSCYIYHLSTFCSNSNINFDCYIITILLIQFINKIFSTRWKMHGVHSMLNNTRRTNILSKIVSFISA